jgi:hypothetical protein
MGRVSITDVWHALAGGELRHGRGRAFWRNGDGFNVAIDSEGERWFDFVQSRGGGVLTLVETAMDCDRRAALSWLEAEGFIESRRLLSTDERRDFAQRRDAAAVLACDVVAWLRAWREQLEVAQERLFADFATFGERRRAILAARTLHRLDTLDAAGLAREFIDQRRREPKMIARLVERGWALDSEARLVTARVVLLLAEAAPREGTHVAA